MEGPRRGRVQDARPFGKDRANLRAVVRAILERVDTGRRPGGGPAESRRVGCGDGIRSRRVPGPSGGRKDLRELNALGRLVTAELGEDGSGRFMKRLGINGYNRVQFSNAATLGVGVSSDMKLFQGTLVGPLGTQKFDVRVKVSAENVTDNSFEFLDATVPVPLLKGLNLQTQLGLKDSIEALARSLTPSQN